MFQTEDLVQESTGEKGFVPVQERHTECDELSAYRSIVRTTPSCFNRNRC